jgi:hypothetical protein
MIRSVRSIMVNQLLISPEDQFRLSSSIVEVQGVAGGGNRSSKNDQEIGVLAANNSPSSKAICASTIP